MITYKTYAVKDLMEWHLPLPTGFRVKPYITIEFEGGHVTGYGVAPARYTTGDPFVQELIENTKWFEKRRIYVLREWE